MSEDAAEALLWTLLRRFEGATCQRYREHVPELATAAKKDLLEALCERAPEDEPLARSALGAPVEAVLNAARSRDAEQTLMTQGLLLEFLGRAIYAAAAEAEALSPDGRALAQRGRAACGEVASEAARLVDEQIGTGDAAFAAFAAATHDVLAALDALAEPVDQTFAERFGVRYSDVLGECTADLMTACQTLGMPRRKVAAHLAGASMGF